MALQEVKMTLVQNLLRKVAGQRIKTEMKQPDAPEPLLDPAVPVVGLRALLTEEQRNRVSKLCDDDTVASPEHMVALQSA